MHQKLDNALDTYDYSGSSVSMPSVVSIDKTRLVFLDNLRAIAVLSVFLYHAGIQVFPVFRTTMERYLNLGSFGVLVFFLCSGYIIPASIERSASLRHFWIRRVFRLYPLYWFSIIFAVLLNYIGLGTISSAVANASFTDVMIQATMVQPLLGAPYFVVVYWTLWYEIVFYFLVSILLLVSLLRRTMLVTIALLILAVLIEVILPTIFNYDWSSKIISYMTVMFVGTLVYRAHNDETQMSNAKIGLLLAALMLGLTNINRFGLLAAIPVITAHMAALALFSVVTFLKILQAPNILTRVGYISYSIYLIHSFVIIFVPRQAESFTTVGVWLVITLLFSAASYSFIEKPTQRFGQYLSRYF